MEFGSNLSTCKLAILVATDTRPSLGIVSPIREFVMIAFARCTFFCPKTAASANRSPNWTIPQRSNYVACNFWLRSVSRLETTARSYFSPISSGATSSDFTYSTLPGPALTLIFNPPGVSTGSSGPGAGLSACFSYSHPGSKLRQRFGHPIREHSERIRKIEIPFCFVTTRLRQNPGRKDRKKEGFPI